MQRILNCRAGTLAHLPDYGLPDMTAVLQGMPASAHQLMSTLSAVLLKYEPRLQRIAVVMLDVLDCGDPERVAQRKALYEAYGFMALPSNPLRMFLPLATVRMLLADEAGD